MGEIINANDQSLSKEQAAEAGVTLTDQNLALSADNLAVSSGPQPSIQQSTGSEQWFTSDRALHLTADDKVVEEDDPAGVKVLIGKGGRIPLSEAQRYGLDAEAARGDTDKAAEPKPLRGKLPEDFPGSGALEAAGVTTYAGVRKQLESLEDIDGIGPATAEKVREAMNESSAEEEEAE